MTFVMVGGLLGSIDWAAWSLPALNLLSTLLISE